MFDFLTSPEKRHFRALESDIRMASERDRVLIHIHASLVILSLSNDVPMRKLDDPQLLTVFELNGLRSTAMLVLREGRRSTKEAIASLSITMGEVKAFLNQQLWYLERGTQLVLLTLVGSNEINERLRMNSVWRSILDRTPDAETRAIAHLRAIDEQLTRSLRLAEIGQESWVTRSTDEDLIEMASWKPSTIDM